jgi:hypothetical protein
MRELSELEVRHIVDTLLEIKRVHADEDDPSWTYNFADEVDECLRILGEPSEEDSEAEDSPS